MRQNIIIVAILFLAFSQINARIGLSVHDIDQYHLQDLSVSDKCELNGYMYDNQCYCLEGFNGLTCETKGFQGKKNTPDKQLSNLTRDLQSDAENANDIAIACLSGFLAAIPPSFCWKKPDFGKIPKGFLKNCPRNTKRYGPIKCRYNCKKAYKLVVLVCKPKKNSFFNQQNSYIPKTIYRTKCPRGMYRVGAMCFRNCSKYGMHNCGIGACSRTKKSCYATIANIALETALAAGGSLTIFLTGGMGAVKANTAKIAIRQFAKKIGPKAIKKSIKLIRMAYKKGKAQFKKKANKESIKALKITQNTLKSRAIGKTCGKLHNQWIKKVMKKTSRNPAIKFVDDWITSGAIKNCKKDLSNHVNQIKCTKSVLGALGPIDFTGLLGVAGSLIHPRCDKV